LLQFHKVEHISSITMASCLHKDIILSDSSTDTGHTVLIAIPICHESGSKHFSSMSCSLH